MLDDSHDECSWFATNLQMLANHNRVCSHKCEVHVSSFLFSLVAANKEEARKMKTSVTALTTLPKQKLSQCEGQRWSSRRLWRETNRTEPTMTWKRPACKSWTRSESIPNQSSRAMFTVDKTWNIYKKKFSLFNILEVLLEFFTTHTDFGQSVISVIWKSKHSISKSLFNDLSCGPEQLSLLKFRTVRVAIQKMYR